MPTLLENVFSNIFGERLFGLELQDTEQKKQLKKLKSPIPPSDDDGSIITQQGISAGAGALSSFLDYGKVINNENELITKYRDMALYPEVEKAMDDIINEMIVLDEEKPAVEIVLDDLEEDFDESILERIRKEFKKCIELLKFKHSGYNLVRYWYIDGRLFLHIMVDFDNPTEGIKEIRYVDPRKIRYIKKPLRVRDEKTQNILHTQFEEYFVYNAAGLVGQETGWKLAKDSIVYVHSGVIDKNGSVVLSQLHKALKPLNQLRMMEDSLVIYRLARAPERRVFTIDVEHVPMAKSQQYVQDIMRQHKNKIVYNTETGQIDTSKRYMTMTDDFYIPVRGGKGTTITQLQGGQNLGQIEDIEYFKRLLHAALNVPESRMQNQAAFNLGRASEITRDEVKFQKFISRQRNQFSQVFDQLLRIQLVLKGIVTLPEWEKMRDKIRYDFMHDTYFAELKEREIWNDRIALLPQVAQFRGVFFDDEWIFKEVLRMTDDEMNDMKKRVKKQQAQNPPGMGMMGDPMGGPPGFGGPPQMGGPPNMNQLPPPDGQDPNQDMQFGLSQSDGIDKASGDLPVPGRRNKKHPKEFKPINASFTRGSSLTSDAQKMITEMRVTEQLNSLKDDIKDIRITIDG